MSEAFYQMQAEVKAATEERKKKPRDKPAAEAATFYQVWAWCKVHGWLPRGTPCGLHHAEELARTLSSTWYYPYIVKVNLPAQPMESK